MIFGRQPAFWIGLGVTIIVGVLSTLTKDGLISEALAGRITDGINALSQLLTILAPVIAGLLIRTQVTPTSAPLLNLGTPVLIKGTGDTPPADGIVSLTASATAAAAAPAP